MSDKPTHAQNGRALERAVRFLQEALLQSDPKLKGIEFSIEPNAIVTVDGVRHEIDVLVKTMPGSPYESVALFECKNRKTPVSKNDVIILAKKVDVVAATRGFMVARNFTGDAKAQAKSDKRIRLITCKEEFLSPLNRIELRHSSHHPVRIEVFVTMRNVGPNEHPPKLEWKGKPCHYQGKLIDFDEFVHRFIGELAREDADQNAARYAEESSHSATQGGGLVFAPGEFTIGDTELADLDVYVEFFVSVRRRKLLSKFELEGQGQVFTFEPIEDPISGTHLEINVIHRANPSGNPLSTTLDIRHTIQ